MQALIFNQFNLIKIFCCFLVVFQHIVGRFLSSDGASASTHIIFGTLLNFSRFAVPIFLFITGFLIMKSYENLSINDFYKSKLSKILYIYLGANFLFIIQNFFLGEYSFELFVRDILFGKASYHLWYLNVLIKVYFLFPIFKYIVNYFNKYLSYKAIFIITIIQYFISGNAYKILSNSTSFAGTLMFNYLDRSLLIWSYYIILGGLAYKNFDKIYTYIDRYKIIFISLFSLSFIYVNLYTFKPFNFIEVNYNRASPSSFRILVYSILSLIVLYYIADYIVKRDSFMIMIFIKRFSKYILFVYIIHPIAISISNKFMPFIKSLPHNIGAFIMITIVLTVSTLPFYVYEAKKQEKSELLSS